MQSLQTLEKEVLSVKVLRCKGTKSDGNRCTREKEFKDNETPEEWRCWQHPKDKKANKKGPGSELPPEKFEQVKADLQIYTSINYIAKRNNVSWDTVRKIEKEHSDMLEKYREQKKKEFADRAWENIQDALEIGQRKLKLTLEQSDNVDQLMDRILDMVSNEEVEFKEVKPLLKRLTALADYSLRDISTFVGTLVDKHELITGNPTEITEEKKKLEDYFS